MLQFQKISKIFKSDLLAQPFIALDEVTFEVPAGSMVGFLGANGAGKTTSLKIIMDFIRADSGKVEFNKSLGKNKIDVFKKIGFLPERPYFYPNLTGNEFLKFMGLLSEMQPAQIRSSVFKWSGRFKIDYALDRPLRTYSKGMLQRIGFLATILHEPQLIILDEPLSGLDPIGRKELKDVIVEVHREGKTVFFSSHIVPDIEEVCDRVIFLKEGKLIYDGYVENLLNSGQETDFIIKFKAPSSGTLDFLSPVKKMDRFPGDLVLVRVSEKVKNDVLNELLQKQINILGMELVKPSLEEIFYNIKAY